VDDLRSKLEQAIKKIMFQRIQNEKQIKEAESKLASKEKLAQAATDNEKQENQIK
jgi:VIT1/CCC1 family predicted Fe2+/Mn2+ transporter